MLAQDDFTPLAVARLLDFFGDRSPWQRRLWAVGTILRLKEAAEAIHLSGETSGLREASVKEAMASARDIARDDPGIGASAERGMLAQLLSTTIDPGSEEHHRLYEIIESAEPFYLGRWARAIRESQPRVEYAARLIAAHLLDGGSSAGHLYRWLDRLRREPNETYTFDQIIEAARSLESSRQFLLLVPIFAMPKVDVPPEGLIDGPTMIAWLQANVPNPPAEIDSRPLAEIAGALVFDQTARDAGAATERIADTLETYRSRVAIGARGSEIRAGSGVFVAGAERPLPLDLRRHLSIQALEQEGRLFAPAAGATIDSALELVALLDRGTPAAAVAGGWAGVESLLKGPGDGGAHQVAPRLALLVACSFVRAELTTLAWRQIRKKGKDDQGRDFARELKALTSNEERSARVADLLLAGGTLDLPNESDVAAESRILKLLQSPAAGLAAVKVFAEDPLRRLYRQRNLVLHGGQTEAIALRAALRVAAPLIGAAVDRLAHAWFVREVEPLRLAATARLRLDRLETPDASPLTALLE